MWDDIVLICIEKGLLAILLVIIGLWANRKLAKYKSILDSSLQNNLILAETRLPAFTSLWAATIVTSPKRENPISNEPC